MRITSILILLLAAGSGFSQRQMRDREADGFKGPVKEIKRESKSLTESNGKWIEEVAKPHETLTYDRAGNRVKQVLYDYRGGLSLIRTYSLIEGAKVCVDEDIRHDYNPPIITVGPPAQNKPRDNRFTYKFKYKYDSNGNRVEEAWHMNDGSLWLRYMSRYDNKGNEVEWMRYTASGELNGRSTSSYDSNGNLIEKSWFDPWGKLSEKWSYSYDKFDSHGNWIKRKTLKWSEGKSLFEPYEFEYRSFLYF